MSGFVDGAWRCSGVSLQPGHFVTDQTLPASWPRPGAAVDWEDDQPEAIKALSPLEASALKARLPMLSPWRVLGFQALAGLGCAALIGAWTLSALMFWSAIYGMAAVVLPGLLLARGMTKRVSSAVAAAAGFMLWELLKIGASMAMLVAAFKAVPGLSWPALLATLVVCIKVNWLALAWRGR
jgi:ATP synthase protein I